MTRDEFIATCQLMGLEYSEDKESVWLLPGHGVLWVPHLYSYVTAKHTGDAKGFSASQLRQYTYEEMIEKLITYLEANREHNNDTGTEKSPRRAPRCCCTGDNNAHSRGRNDQK